MKTTLINGVILIPPLTLTLLGMPHIAAIYFAVITGIWLAAILYH